MTTTYIQEEPVTSYDLLEKLAVVKTEPLCTSQLFYNSLGGGGGVEFF